MSAYSPDGCQSMLTGHHTSVLIPAPTAPGGAGSAADRANQDTEAMPIDPWLPRAAALRPDHVALEAPGGTLTYAELLERARLDLAPGSRVALTLEPGLEFAVAL